MVTPAQSASAGLDRLVALCAGYLGHVERRVFPGGCFFASVASAVSSRAGTVRDRVAAEHAVWTALLPDNASRAVDAGELPADTDAAQLVTELSTMLTGADIAYLLHDDEAVIVRILAAVRSRLEPSSVPPVRRS